MTCRWLLIWTVRARTHAGGLPQRYGPGDGRYPGYEIGPQCLALGVSGPAAFNASLALLNA